MVNREPEVGRQRCGQVREDGKAVGIAGKPIGLRQSETGVVNTSEEGERKGRAEE